VIQFKCPKCQAAIKVGDDKAGTVVPCPGCKVKLRAPAAKAPPAKKKPVEEPEEVAPMDDDEDEAPRKKKKPARARDEDDDEDDRPKKGKRRKKGRNDEGGGGSVVSGIVYIVLGIIIAIVGLIAPNVIDNLQVNPLVPRIFGPVAGGLIAGLGIFYIVRK